jgi:phosphate transport system protein
MSHYEERLERDLTAIRAQVARLGGLVEEALSLACRALLTVDRELAAETILGDIAVNNESRELDRLCHVFVARHLPSAGHLRLISSVLRLSVALERIGDYSETISRTAAQISDVPPDNVRGDIQMMVTQASLLLHEAMKSFGESNPDLARATIQLSRQFVTTSDKVYADLLAEGEKGSRPINDLFTLLATFNRLERVIHQSKNICEETIFSVTGKTKPPKKFDILFLDERGSGASALAEHLARKAYPEIGKYASAGWAPARTLDSAYVEFAEQKGIDLSKARLETVRCDKVEDLSAFDIVVTLDPDGRTHIGKLPFHTIHLQWDLDTSRGPAEVYRQLADRLSALMDKLQGKRAPR